MKYSNATGWHGLAAIALTALLNELLPVIFGTGYKAIWDWSFLFVTLRFIVVPCLALLYIGVTLSFAIKQHRLAFITIIRCLGAALLAGFSWLYHGPLFVIT
jgi:hypothetical protein